MLDTTRLIMQKIGNYLILDHIMFIVEEIMFC